MNTLFYLFSSIIAKLVEFIDEILLIKIKYYIIMSRKLHINNIE